MTAYHNYIEQTKTKLKVSDEEAKEHIKMTSPCFSKACRSILPLTDQGRLEQNNCVFERGRSVSCCAICADVTTFLVALTRREVRSCHVAAGASLGAY